MKSVLSDEERKARRRASWKQYREKNRERLLAKAREKYAADPEREKSRHKEWASKNGKHLREYGGRRYKDNPEIKKAQVRKWRRAHPEYTPMACRRWVQNNPEKARESWRRAGILRRGAAGSFSTSDIIDIRRLQKGKCAYCKKPVSGKDEHVDHIIAISNGGTHNRANLQILCERCNKRKFRRDPVEFARTEHGLLL